MSARAITSLGAANEGTVHRHDHLEGWLPDADRAAPPPIPHAEPPHWRLPLATANADHGPHSPLDRRPVQTALADAQAPHPGVPALAILAIGPLPKLHAHREPKSSYR